MKYETHTQCDTTHIEDTPARAALRKASARRYIEHRESNEVGVFTRESLASYRRKVPGGDLMYFMSDGTQTPEIYVAILSYAK